MGIKLKFGLDKKKGYLQIDFAFAILIFILFIFFSYQYYVDFVNATENNFEVNRLNGLSRDLCSMFVLSSGKPSSWELDVSTLESVGFRESGSYNLSLAKVAAINNSFYYDVLDNMAIDDDVYLVVTGVESGTNYLSFGIAGDYGVLSSSYVCYSVYNNEIVKVYVEVWK